MKRERGREEEGPRKERRCEGKERKRVEEEIERRKSQRRRRRGSERESPTRRGRI
jgi:hypothetical protein